MELEFAADADAISLLLRAKPLLACREGRPRTQSVKIVWHDSPDHALRTAGLAVAEQRGVWRIERLIPGTEPWLPAHPAPVVAEPPDPASLPSPLAPLAAFEGRRTASVHLFDGSAVTLTVARGVLRAVTAERAAGRLWLSGEPAAVRAAITLIAEAAPVAVPRATLAAEAIALASGGEPPPRRSGAPKLPDHPLPVADALRHILGHLTDAILACAPAAERADEHGIEAVHQMRVAVRRARSALAVFRPALPPGALDTVRDGLKDLGSRLGPRRDWDVFIGETLPAIRQSLPGDERLARLAAAAERHRRDCQKALTEYLRSAAFRALTIEFAFVIATFDVTAEPMPDIPPALSDFAGQVMAQRHRKLVSSGKRMQDLDIPALHGVRLRAKQVRYAAEMFATLHPGRSAERFIRRLSVLQQRLGVLNDGAVAHSLMEQLGGPTGRHAYAAGVVAGYLAARTTKFRPRIIRAFEKFKRQQTYWG